MDDLSTTGNNGTITGTADHTGQVGRARGFDGVDDQIVSVSNPFSSLSSFTIALWLKPTVSGSNLPLSADAAGIHYISYGIVSANRYTVTWRTGATTGQLTASSTNATGTYKHIAITYNGHTLRLFRDAVSQASAIATGTFTTNSFRVGQRVGGLNLYTGDIDELRIYNRTLSMSDVDSIFTDTIEYPIAVQGEVNLRPIHLGQRKVMHYSRRSLAEIRSGNY